MNLPHSQLLSNAVSPGPIQTRAASGAHYVDGGFHILA